MFLSKPKLTDLPKFELPRDELIRRSRILIIDDEEPGLRRDLEQAGFSVNYQRDVDKSAMQLIEKPWFDLVLLDFSGVGRVLGPDQGLAILRHMKRVNPSVVVLSYTSKALSSEHADFYRLTDGVLPKDAGIGDSFESIERALRKAHSVENLWRSFLATMGAAPGSKDDLDLQATFVRAVGKKRKQKALQDHISTLLTSDEARAAALAVLGKLLELGFKAMVHTGG